MKHKINCSDAFYKTVSEWLNDATLHSGRENFEFKRISGVVRGDAYRARIDIVFRPEHLKKSAPIVFCEENWIRRNLDWHCFRAKGSNDAWEKEDRLCWIHPLEWQQAHHHQLKRLTLVIEEGSEWLKNNVIKLLDRHWVGHELGIKKWKSEWGGWGHGQSGTNQFLSELKNNGHPKNWQKIPQSNSKHT